MSDRIPQWVRDTGFITVFATSAFVGWEYAAIHDPEHLGNVLAPATIIGLVGVFGVRILSRITQLEQKLRDVDRSTGGADGVDEIRWPKPEGSVRWQDDAKVKP